MKIMSYNKQFLFICLHNLLTSETFYLLTILSIVVLIKN